VKSKKFYGISPAVSNLNTSQYDSLASNSLAKAYGLNRPKSKRKNLEKQFSKSGSIYHKEIPKAPVSGIMHLQVQRRIFDGRISITKQNQNFLLGDEFEVKIKLYY